MKTRAYAKALYLPGGRSDRTWTGSPAFMRFITILLILAVMGGGLAVAINSVLAAPLGYSAIFNHPYAEPAPVVFGPDLAAWSRYQDHPGYDTAYTMARSQAYAGIASPNHIHTGSNALTFFGYNSAANLDYILSEEYSQFSGVSFELRPSELNFSALSQSGFLFNGSVADVSGQLFYTGYMIALEADSTGTSADLALYHVVNAPLSSTAAAFENPALRTLISTYAIGIATTGQPVYIRVEANPAVYPLQFQVYIDGELRTQDLAPVSTDTSFGFFATYANRATTNLTKVTYSNLRFEVPWVSKTATAKVYFKLAGTNTDLFDPQTITGKAAGGYGGQNGQNHYIIPPAIPGYTWVDDPAVALDFIPYFARNEYNETILYFVQDTSASTKTAWYEGAQDNGTAATPVLVEKNKIIDYEVFAAGDGVNLYLGDWTTAQPVRQGLMTMKNLIPGYNPGNDGTYYMVVPSLPHTSTDGKMTVMSNYPLQVGEIQSSNNGFGANDGSVLGFRPTPAGATFKGTPAELPYPAPACDHTVPTDWSVNNYGLNLPKIRSDERYISITYNNLQNYDGYQFDYLLGTWKYGKFEDYIITFIGLDSKGNPARVTYQSNQYPPFTNRVLGSSNNGGPAGTTPLTANLLPATTDYKDPYDGQSYICPDNGKIEVIFTRIHNSNHDYNIFIGAGEIARRARATVMTVIDYLPAGLTYVTGSSGQYEGNLTTSPGPNGTTKLIWSFSTLPPEGYTIPFQAKVSADGLFINHAEVEYGSAIPLENERTNNTYHWTGMASVVEHFLDYSNPSGPQLRTDNTLRVYLNSSYTTSGSSMGNILTSNGDVYRYVGYKRIGTDGSIQTGPPPSPTISNVTGDREIDLYFEKCPVVTVEFRQIGSETPLKLPVDYPVNYGDPFFLPDSARAQITYLGDVYTYCAYAKTGDLLTIIDGLPPKPVYGSVTQDQTIIVYFTPTPSVTVRYVERNNVANVLKNNDYFLIDPAPDNDFILTEDLYSVIYRMGKYYRYEGYSYPGGPFTPGPPPQDDFEGIEENMEVILHFEEAVDTSVLERFHRLSTDAQLQPDKTRVIPFGGNYNRSPEPPATISSGGRIYGYVGYSINGGTAVLTTLAGTPATLLTKVITDGNYVTYLYEAYYVTEEFRLWVDHDEALDGDKQVSVAHGANYNRSPMPPAALTGGDGKTYNYVGYSINGGTPVLTNVAGTPATPITNVTSEGNRITYLYGISAVTEQFHRLSTDAELLGDERVNVTFNGNYNRGTIPPATITGSDDRVYGYVGYSINGGTFVPGDADTAPFKNVTDDENVITYFYEACYVTEQFRLWINHNTQLDDDNDVSVAHGGNYTGTPPGALSKGGVTYSYVGYDLNDGNGPILGSAPNPSFANVTAEGNVITYLYGGATFVTEQFRLWDDRGTFLSGDEEVPVLFGEDYTGAPPAEITTPEGKIYDYVGYDLNDGGGQILGAAPDPSFTDVVTDENVITYLYQLRIQSIALHIRQIVIGPTGSLSRPVMGYYTLLNEGKILPLASNSLVLPEFTDYTLIPGDNRIYTLTDIVPQYFEFVGHVQNDGGSAVGHPEAAPYTPMDTTPPNGQIELNYTETGEIWITVYITPEGAPGKQQTSVETNKFGTVYETDTPPAPSYAGSVKAIENADFLRHANIVLCLDMSSSMNLNDVLEGQIDAAMQFVSDLFSNAPVDISVNLITYNYRPVDQMTVDETDYGELLAFLDELEFEDMGTNFAQALDMARTNLSDLAAVHPHRQNFVVFLGDGRPGNSHPEYQSPPPAPGPWYDERNNRDVPENVTAMLGVAEQIKQYAKFISVYYGNDPNFATGDELTKIQKGIQFMKDLSSNAPGDENYYYEAFEENPELLTDELMSVLECMNDPVEWTVPAGTGQAVIQLLHPLVISATKPVKLTVNGITTTYTSAVSPPLSWNPITKQLILDVTGYPTTANIIVEYWTGKSVAT